jgi:transcriptional regulator with XRE-family HTH domain
MSQQIREAILSSEMSRYRICQEIGITQPTMTRFMNGQAWLSMPTLDKIADLLDLNIIKGKGRHKKG